MQRAYCLNTSTIRNCGLNVQEKIKVTAQAGYQGIEIWVSEIEDYLKNGGTLPKLKAILDQYAITMPNLIAFPQWAHPDATIRAKALEEAKYVFEMAKALDSTYVAAPPMGITEMVDLPLEDIAGYYKDLIKAVQNTGVTPLLEFWGHSKKLGSLKEAIQVMKLVGESEVVLLADVFHAAKTKGSFELLAELKGSQLGLLHVNDYPYADDIKKLNDSQRVYPGDGVAPLKQIFDTLKKIGYNGMFSLELFNEEYEKSGAENVAKTGLEKMKQIFE
jgi:sugar phosphate isomerase/epimerase